MASNDNPAGRVSPVATENDGAGKPDAVNVYEYAEFTSAAGGAAAVNTGFSRTVKEIGSDVTSPTEFFATTRNVLVLAVVGVPESSPVVASRVSPAGRMSSAATAKVGAGVPDAVNVYKYADPAVAAGGAAAVNAGAAVNETRDTALSE
ncbi:hypothetical protein OVA17_05250 [Microbacterium sp. SL75]|nr:hypothetical protein [Microbacterium sp. SL75]WAC70101.1 hypothetical protein OVA17_05250 [Microbacterium sp. SL75]